MRMHLDFPFIVFGVALVVQGIAAFTGDFLRKHTQRFKEGERHDFSTIQAATLTLLALIVGFTFSMAVTRYDQRKNLEEAEANAIGTEYLRADLLPDDLGARTRDLLRQYLAQRIALYEETDGDIAQDINQRTAKLQNELWASVLPATTRQPTPIVALVVAGMNDVINSQGYTQAAWWNRIPAGAGRP